MWFFEEIFCEKDTKLPRCNVTQLLIRSVPAEEINVRDVYPKIYPMQVGFRKRGESGIEVTDWWPHLSACVDDLCFVRNMWTTDNDHAAENQIHTGRHRLDETQPSIGAWAHYGLGSMNENLPRLAGRRPRLRFAQPREIVQRVILFIWEGCSFCLFI